MSSLVTCLYPRHIYNKYIGVDVAVPCGECSACKALKASSWATRLEMESQLHKYCLFVTLTYGTDKVPFTYLDDLINSDYTSKTLDKAIHYSSEYLKVNDGVIYHHSVAHIQNFMKRLRINLIRHLKLKEDERQLRYFFAFEFGPSGFRPHYHALLWFDSDKIASAIKEYIFKAWQPYTTLQDFSSFERVNKMSFVRTSCSQYVAGYLNTDSQLPAILREKPFRQRHLQSSRPPIGSLFVQQKQIQALFFGDACKIGFVKPSSGRFVDMSLWRGLESKYFPRCPKFDILTPAERIAMYKFSSTFGRDESYKSFKQRFYSEWEKVFYTPQFDALGIVEKSYVPQMWQLYARCFTLEEKDGMSIPLESSIKRWYYQSRRVRRNAELFGCSMSYYVAKVEEYYQRKNYSSLVTQLEFEQSLFSNQQFKGAGMELKYLPYLIDPLFYENVRKLDSFTYDCYLRQFHVDDEFRSLPFYSPLWRQKKVLFNKIMMENTKTRVHKEFVALHPEYSLIYLQNRLSYATFS